MEEQKERPARRPGETNTHPHSSRRLDIKTVAAAALASAETVVSRWLPDGKRHGSEWVSLNPTRSDAHSGSFSVNLDTGRWGDFATGDKGGDLVSLVAYLEGTNQGEAAERLGGFLGLTSTATAPEKRPGAERRPPAPAAKPAAGPAPIQPIPPEALETRLQGHPQHGKPSAEWIYRDPSGAPLFFVCRFDPPNGRKQFAPLTYWPDGWHWKAPPAPRPLYGLDRLTARPNAPVLICEGEKSADAAAALLPAMGAVSTFGGAQAPAKTDFAPLSGRRVFLWPDNDPPGGKYAAAVAALARTAGVASFAILDLRSLAKNPKTGAGRDLPGGWDAADALADGWDAETLAAAARWEPFPFLPEGKPAPKRTNGAADPEAPELPRGFFIDERGLWFEPPPSPRGAYGSVPP